MFRRFLPALALAALALPALALGAAPAAPTEAQAQARRDWTRTIAATPEGGVRMGNPAAALKVVEYVSLSCPHCRDFAESGMPRLEERVARGGVSFELRPFPLDPVAAVGAQLTRCVAPGRAFALNDAILSTQPAWFARLDGLNQAQIAELQGLAPAALRQRIAVLTGFDALAAQHGLTAAQVGACLADDGGAARIDAIKAAAEALGVGGTPSFLLNGALAANVHDWAALEPLLTPRR